MQEITKNEITFVLTLLKTPEIEFNANNISKKIGISSMGTLKIAKRLEKENIILPKRFGKAVFYKLNLDKDYVIQYVKLLLKREAEQAQGYVKVWISEIKKIKNADCAVIFGSILKKYKEANDIDVLLVTDKNRFAKLKKEIEDINLINIKNIHPMFQTKEDLINNIKKRDSVVFNAIKGIVVFGEDLIIKILAK